MNGLFRRHQRGRCPSVVYFGPGADDAGASSVHTPKHTLTSPAPQQVSHNAWLTHSAANGQTLVSTRARSPHHGTAQPFGPVRKPTALSHAKANARQASGPASPSLSPDGSGFGYSGHRGGPSQSLASVTGGGRSLRTESTDSCPLQPVDFSASASTPCIPRKAFGGWKLGGGGPAGSPTAPGGHSQPLSLTGQLGPLQRGLSGGVNGGMGSPATRHKKKAKELLRRKLRAQVRHEAAAAKAVQRVQKHKPVWASRVEYVTPVFATLQMQRSQRELSALEGTGTIEAPIEGTESSSWGSGGCGGGGGGGWGGGGGF